jgi:hypothetical protein
MWIFYVERLSLRLAFVTDLNRELSFVAFSHSGLRRHQACPDNDNDLNYLINIEMLGREDFCGWSLISAI